MNDFNSEYYIVIAPRDDDKVHDLLPSLSPDEATATLPFRYEALPFGSKPLVFEAAFKEFRAKRGLTLVRHPPDILFEGSNPVVRSGMREKLLALEIPNLALQPAIFIDDWGTWHEDYWYLTFTQRLDCWSRKDSEYEKGHPVRVGPGENLYGIYSLRLDAQVLDPLPLAQRRLFQLGGSTDAFILAHQSVAPLFGGGNSGAQVLRLEEYPDQY